MKPPGQRSWKPQSLAAKAEASEVEVARAALAVVQQEQRDPDYLLKVYDARIASTEAELSKLRDEAVRTDIRRQIVIGHRSDREAEVRQGLNQGERVILHPTEQIREGIRVTAR